MPLDGAPFANARAAVAGKPDRASIERLLDAFRTEVQITRSMALMREGIRAGLGHEVRSGRLERKRLPRLEGLVDRSFGPDALLDSIREALASELLPGDVDPLLSFALSPLGQRALDAEDVATRGDVRAALGRFARTFGDHPEHETRWARAVEMERVIGFADAQAGFVIDTQRAMLGGLALSSGPAAHPELDILIARLDELRATLPDRMRELMTLQLAFTYRGLSLADQDAVLEHLSTPAAGRLSDALVRGMSEGLQRASIEFGDRLGRSTAIATIDEEI